MRSDAPDIKRAGLDGFIVRFGSGLSEAANRAALAFRAALEDAGWDALQETSTSLVSTYLRFDPLQSAPAEVQARLEALVATQDWHDVPLPAGRTLWRIPTAFGGTYGPQLDEAAAAAGLSAQEAVASIAETRLRVLTVGFAPGMPYLGTLPDAWDIPRQRTLTARVPEGGLCVALRQLVLFPVATPTGWRHIGQTRFALFRPDAAAPFRLKSGDEVMFEPVSEARFDALAEAPGGGATDEALP